MSKNRKLKTLTNPQVWLGSPKNGMIECVILENWGDGPLAARLWVPYKGDKYDVREQSAALEKVKKRVKLDFGIELGHYSSLCSKDNPLDKLLK